MTFSNFFNPPLQQILAEVAEINRRNGAPRNTPFTSNVSVKVKCQSFGTDPGLDRLKAVHTSPTSKVEPVAAHISVTVTKAPGLAAPDVPGVVGPPVTGIGRGLDRLKAVHTSPTGIVEPVTAVRNMPNKTCRFFLSRNGCRYQQKCRSAHDYDALDKLRKQWSSDDSKKKLQQVRANQQLTYTKEVLAVKSNNAKASLATKVDVSTSVVVAQTSKPFSKAPTKKSEACKRYLSTSGCSRKNCPYYHEDLPSEPEKLIDDTIPGEVKVPINPRSFPRKPRKASKQSKPTLAKVADPEETGLVAKPIVWAGNPNLSDDSFCTSARLQIFGWDQPTKQVAIKWFQDMHANGDLKHFTIEQLQFWAKAIGLKTLKEFSAYIATLPDVFEKLIPSQRANFSKLKAEHDAEEAKPKYDTFHRFGDLPAEVCIDIWGFAARSGRQLRVRFNQGVIYTEGGPGLFKRESSPSPLWYVNHQSEKASMLDKHCAYYFGCDYFSPSFDTLFLNDSAKNLHRFANQVRLWRGAVVQRLALPWYQVHNALSMTTLAADLRKAFPCIIRIEFLLSDSEYHSKDAKKAPGVTAKAEIEIHAAYKNRIGVQVPRVRLIMVPEEQAAKIGIDSGIW